jgi:invasion protein IalB
MIGHLKSLIPAAAALALCLVAPAMAQEEDADAAGGVGAKTTTETIGSWTVTCSEGGKANRCVMQQRLATKEKRQVVASATIRVTKEGGAELIIAMPTGVVIGPGMAVTVDEAEAGKAAFRTCGPRVCQAAVSIDQDLINKLAKGKTLGATVQTLRGKPLGLQFTLDGFTKAYSAFKKSVSQ